MSNHKEKSILIIIFFFHLNFNMPMMMIIVIVLPQPQNKNKNGTVKKTKEPKKTMFTAPLYLYLAGKFHLSNFYNYKSKYKYLNIF